MAESMVKTFSTSAFAASEVTGSATPIASANSYTESMFMARSPMSITVCIPGGTSWVSPGVIATRILGSYSHPG